MSEVKVGAVLREGPLPATRLDADRVNSLVDARGVRGESEVRLPQVTPISRQIGGSCVANAFCDGLEILKGIEDPSSVEQLSRSALYYWSRCRHGAQDKDEGTYPSAAAAQLLTVGVVPEKLWEHTEEHLFKAPPVRLTMMAAANRVQGVHQIADKGVSLLDTVEWSVRAGMPVVCCLELTQGFRDPSWDAVLDAGGATWGSHAMLVVGFRHGSTGREYLLRNSWGTGWGNGGYVWITAKLLQEAFGLFMLTLMKGLVY